MTKPLGIDLTEDLEIRNIFASAHHPYLQDTVTIASPQVLTAGTVLYESGGKALKWDDASDVVGVLMEDVDASDGDVSDALVAFGGPFNQNALIATTTPVAVGKLPGEYLIHVVKEY